MKKQFSLVALLLVLSASLGFAQTFELPYYDDFSNKQEVMERYTFIDVNKDANGDLNRWACLDGKMQFKTKKIGIEGDDWLITPGIHVDAKGTYKLTFTLVMSSYADMQVTLGTSTDPKDHTVVMDLKHIHETFPTGHEVSFEVPEAGTYYIGFYNYSAMCNYGMNILDMYLTADKPYAADQVFQVPFFDNFLDGDRANTLYTMVDVDNDKDGSCNAWHWMRDNQDWEYFQYNSDKKHLGNDWIISPAIYFDGQDMYDVNIGINSGAPANLKVMLGTSTDPADFTTEIMDLKGFNSPGEVERHAAFSVPEPGNYYLAVYCYSDLEASYLNFFRIGVKTSLSGIHPRQVSDLTITPDLDGELVADISFKAPTTNIRGEAITDAFSVDMYRGDKVVKTFSVTAGEVVTYQDTEIPVGNNTYKFVTKVGELESMPLVKTVWVGFDSTEAVHDYKVVTSEDNQLVMLSWSKPTKAANGGFVNLDKVRYCVYRSLDDENYECIAPIVLDTTYTDSQIKEVLQGKQESVTYVVRAVTSGGESEPVSKKICVGTPYPVNTCESFTNGFLTILPWVTQRLDGYFGWKCLMDDAEGGVSPLDCDQGFIRYKNQGDGRLKSPIFDLTTGKNPTFSFYMLHWEASSIAPDNESTKCTIEISVDGGDFEPLGPAYTAAYESFGWFEHRLSLEKYKDAKKVQFALRGASGNNWMYYYVDKIQVDEQFDNDLSIAEFSAGSLKTQVNDTVSYDIRYVNRGLKEASGYTIDLYQDGKLVKSLEGEPIAPGAYKSVQIQHAMTGAKADRESVIYAKINYDVDEVESNNTSWELISEVKGIWYPSVTNLQGVFSGEGGIELSWDAPAIPQDPVLVKDGFEDYESFAIKDFGEWITVDGDHRRSGCYTGFPNFPNKEKNMAFMVWAPTDFEGFDQEYYANLLPRTGDKCLISWYANRFENGEAPVNDDWLISPEVLGGSKLRFYLKRIAAHESEEYEILYSSTDTAVESFKVIKNGMAAGEWELIEVTLPEDARYFAIHYMGKLQAGIMIDDLEYISAVSGLVLNGYRIFRDDMPINTEEVKENTYRDLSVEADKSYEYRVSAIFQHGESNACDPISVVATGIDGMETKVVVYTDENGIYIRPVAPVQVCIYTLEGHMLLVEDMEAARFIPVNQGLYLVKIGDQCYKVMVK